jgi:dTMP kinase
MERGRFITIEGIEGSGKTSQASALAQALRDEGRSVQLTHEPGGTSVGEALRAIFLDPTIQLAASAELLLVLADRAQHVNLLLKPALERGEVVISDRYSDSTIAYQGYGRGLDLARVQKLNAFASDGLMPDRTIVLDCPVELGLARARRRSAGVGAPDRFEAAALEFHRRVREGFCQLARLNPQRIRLIDSSGDRAQVHAQIMAVAREALTG